MKFALLLLVSLCCALQASATLGMFSQDYFLAIPEGNQASAFDAQGNLYVSLQYDHKLIYFPAALIQNWVPGTPLTEAQGVAVDLTQQPALSADNLINTDVCHRPFGLVVSAAGKLYGSTNEGGSLCEYATFGSPFGFGRVMRAWPAFFGAGGQTLGLSIDPKSKNVFVGTTRGIYYLPNSDTTTSGSVAGAFYGTWQGHSDIVFDGINFGADGSLYAASHSYDKMIKFSATDISPLQVTDLNQAFNYAGDTVDGSAVLNCYNESNIVKSYVITLGNQRGVYAIDLENPSYNQVAILAPPPGTAQNCYGDFVSVGPQNYLYGHCFNVGLFRLTPPLGCTFEAQSPAPVDHSCDEPVVAYTGCKNAFAASNGNSIGLVFSNTAPITQCQ